MLLVKLMRDYHTTHLWTRLRSGGCPTFVHRMFACGCASIDIPFFAGGISCESRLPLAFAASKTCSPPQTDDSPTADRRVQAPGPSGELCLEFPKLELQSLWLQDFSNDPPLVITFPSLYPVSHILCLEPSSEGLSHACTNILFHNHVISHIIHQY